MSGNYLSVIRPLLAAVFIVGLMWLAGSCVFSFFKKNTTHPRAAARDGNFESLFFNVALGYGVVSLFVFFQGVAGLYQGIKFYLSFAVFISLILVFIWRAGFTFRAVNLFPAKIKSPVLAGTNSISIFFYSLSVLALLVAFALSFLPPHYYDSLVYHLALPAGYIKNNSITPLSYNLYSHFPQDAEMIFLLALKIGGGVSANLVTFILSLLLALYVRNFIINNLSFPMENSSTAASAGFLILTTATFFTLLAPSTYVELHQTFLSFGALASAVRYIDAISKKTLSPSENWDSPAMYLILSGFLAGIALGVKYTAFGSLVAINLMLAVAHIIERDKNRNTFIVALRDFILFNTVAILFFSPWLVKNYIFARNPVFPFFYNFFSGGSSSVGWNSRAALGYFSALTEYSHKSSVFMEMIALPYNLLVRPLKFGGGIDVLGDFGWYPFFLFGVILAFPFVMRNRKISPTGFYILIYTFVVGFIWFFTKPVLRFLVPLSAPLAVLSGLVAGYILEKKSFLLKSLTALLLVGFAVQNFYYSFFITGFFRPLAYLLGKEDESLYLARTLKHSPTPAFDFINEFIKIHPAMPHRVLFVGEQRSFYCQAHLVAPSVFAPNPLVEWADGCASGNALLDKIKSEGFTLIFYNIREGERLRPYGIFDFTERGQKNWKGLLEILRREIIYQDKNSVIYDIS